MNNSKQYSIAACQSGDREALTALYEDYVDKIYAYVYYRTFHQQTAEDITSMVFVKVLSSLSSYSEASGTLQSWIYAIARNTLTDHYRTKRKEFDIASLWDMASNNDMAHTAQVRHMLGAVREVMTEMSPQQQEILVLRLWDGLSYKEIATILGKSEAAAKMSFSRAVAALRGQLPVMLLLGIFIKGFTDHI